MSKRKKKQRATRSSRKAAKRRSEEHKSGFDRTSLDVPEGVNLFGLKSDRPIRIDIIPYKVGKGNPYADEGELHWERTFFVHRGIGPEQNNYVCPRRTADKKCPICEHRTKLMKDPEADEDLIKDLAPKERQLFNIVDTKDRDKGVQIWDISFWLFGKALDALRDNADEDDDYEAFADLEGGMTLKCAVEEKRFSGNTYYEVINIIFKPRREDYDEDMLDKSNCLDEVVKILPYKELKAIFLQTEDEDNDEDDEDNNDDDEDFEDAVPDKDNDDDDDDEDWGDEDEEGDDDDDDDDDEDDEHEDDEEDEPEEGRGKKRKEK